MELPVYFISDLHLMLTPSEREAQKLRKLSRFFQEVQNTGGTLFLVGDIFDFYFEYYDTIPKTYFRIFNWLYTLKNDGIEVHYLLGNHDYWVKEFVTETLTTKTYFDDTQFELSGKRFYLTHGDGVLSWDRGYRILKYIIRSRVCIWGFRWLHPRLGYRFARWISDRGHHYTHTEEYNQTVFQELKTFAEGLIAQGSDYVISGHYHQANMATVNGGTLLVLGDWINYFSYGYFDGDQLHLKFWERDE